MIEIQWPFQEPKLEVPTIYKDYFSGLNFREYPHNSYGQKYATFTYLHFRILSFPLTGWWWNIGQKYMESVPPINRFLSHGHRWLPRIFGQSSQAGVLQTKGLHYFGGLATGVRLVGGPHLRCRWGCRHVAISPCELDSGEKSWELMGIPWKMGRLFSV